MVKFCYLYYTNLFIELQEEIDIPKHKSPVNVDLIHGKQSPTKNEQVQVPEKCIPQKFNATTEEQSNDTFRSLLEEQVCIDIFLLHSILISFQRYKIALTNS